MFTGLIRCVGVVGRNAGKDLEVRVALRARPGESVAVSGACLTVTGCARGTLRFEVGPETRRLTNLSRRPPGARVNLEPSLRLGEALGGHLVSGHVDAAAEVSEISALPGGFARLAVGLPPALRGLLAIKGSIAVDGVSLTVTRVSGRTFETMLVPHTLGATTLGELRRGALVNLEADMLARYVRSALEARG